MNLIHVLAILQEKRQQRHQHRRTHHQSQRDKARRMEELANVAGVYGVRTSSPSQFSPAALT